MVKELQIFLIQVKMGNIFNDAVEILHFFTF